MIDRKIALETRPTAHHEARPKADAAKHEEARHPADHAFGDALRSERAKPTQRARDRRAAPDGNPQDEDEAPAQTNGGPDAALLARLLGVLPSAASTPPSGGAEPGAGSPAKGAAIDGASVALVAGETGVASETDAGAMALGASDSRDATAKRGVHSNAAEGAPAPDARTEHRARVDDAIRSDAGADARGDPSAKPNGVAKGDDTEKRAPNAAPNAGASASAEKRGLENGATAATKANDEKPAATSDEGARSTANERSASGTEKSARTDDAMTGMPTPGGAAATGAHPRSEAEGAATPSAPVADAHLRPEVGQVSLLTVKHATHAEVEHADLGRVSIDAHERAGVIDVTLRASNVETAAALVAIEPALRAELHDNALALGDYQVDPSGVRGDARGDSSANLPQNSERRDDHGAPRPERDAKSTGATSAPVPRERRVRIVL